MPQTDIVSYAEDGRIAVLTIDNPPVNALSHALKSGLYAGLERADKAATVDAAVIRCAGRTFVAGADIGELQSGKANEPPTLLDVLARIEAMTKPVVAALHGTALGGGLELALACHFRVAVADARMGLPEVKLGILPGAGGTQRLTRLTGPDIAIDLIASGRQFPASQALEWGVIDAIVGDLQADAVAFARRAVEEKRPLVLVSERDSKISGVSPDVFSAWRKKVASQYRGLDAPQRIVDSVEAACFKPKAEGFAFERACFEALMKGEQRRALMHLFAAERAARKISDIDKNAKPRHIGRLGVVGTGLMGSGIAIAAANAGVTVTILGRSKDSLARARAAIEKTFARSVERGALSQEKADAALGRISGSRDMASFSEADLVVEAVFEDLELKRALFSKLDAAAPRALLATNTSTLDIDEIAAGTHRPEDVIGAHFFSPANIMKLLEVVRGRDTSDEAIATVMEFGRELGKIPVLARSGFGFIGNRMFLFYLAQAEFLVEEGATPEQVDGVAERFGFAMGPLAVADLLGLDIAEAMRKTQSRLVPKDERKPRIIPRLLARGRMGQKTGSGVYRYDGRARLDNPETLTLAAEIAAEAALKRRDFTDEEILARLLHPLVNEGARLLEDGVAQRASDIDVVYVHGYGFPAWRGGPMFWAERAGLAGVAETSAKLSKELGGRWAPARLLERLAKNGAGWPKDGA